MYESLRDHFLNPVFLTAMAVFCLSYATCRSFAHHWRQLRVNGKKPPRWQLGVYIVSGLLCMTGLTVIFYHKIVFILGQP